MFFAGFLAEICGTWNAPVVFSDANSLTDAMGSFTTKPKERNLLPDLEALRESVSATEETKNRITLRWCETELMLADCLTKLRWDLIKKFGIVIQTGAVQCRIDPADTVRGRARIRAAEAEKKEPVLVENPTLPQASTE